MKKPAAKSPKRAKKERVMPILLQLRARVSRGEMQNIKHSRDHSNLNTGL